MKIALGCLALLILASAAGAVTRRNLIHSALLLVGTWFGIAGFYLWAGAEFVAFGQVLVYGGAVSMVVLFAVLLTRRGGLHPTETGSRGRALAALGIGIAVFTVLAGAVLCTHWPASAPTPLPLTVHALGLRLIGPQAASVLAIGALLTVALLGAVVLATARSDQRREDR